MTPYRQKLCGRMAPIAGTYRLITSDNMLAECEATYSSFLPAADIKLLAAAGNQWTIIIKEKEGGLTFKAEFR